MAVLPTWRVELRTGDGRRGVHDVPAEDAGTAMKLAAVACPGWAPLSARIAEFCTCSYSCRGKRAEEHQRYARYVRDRNPHCFEHGRRDLREMERARKRRATLGTEGWR